jgi:5-methylcytosine-specific restriction endonuclease McrA
MDITLPAPSHIHIIIPLSVLIAIGAIIVGLVLLRLLSRRRRRHATHHRRAGARPQGRSTTRRKPDHGARVAKQHGHARSPHWGTVEKAHLLREPACVACGYQGKGLQVHHIKPFHLHPALELDPNNLITLCEIKERDHHLLIGHLDDWESYNIHVKEDVRRFYKETANQIRENAAWQKKVLQRP